MSFSLTRALFVFLFFLLLGLGLVSAQEPDAKYVTKKYMTVHGTRMAYVEVGHGEPVVFLHGNPTSSYVWRSVMPLVAAPGRRLIAPDMIGFGDSDKLPGPDDKQYSIRRQMNYIFALLEKLGVKDGVTFVLHDWGTMIGFQWAYENRFNPDAVKGIVFFEGYVKTFKLGENVGLEDFKRQFFPPPKGHQLVLRDNYIIEVVLPSLMFKNLSPEEFNEYRRPFNQPGELRRPMLSFPRQLPINGHPEDVSRLVDKYSEWLPSAPFRKLFFSATPGALITGAHLAYARTFRNLTEVNVTGVHYLQEDTPETLGTSISLWMDQCPLDQPK